MCHRYPLYRGTKIPRYPYGYWIYGAVLVWLISVSTYALELDQCNKALGMENGDIADIDITASSAYDSGSVGPKHARLRQEKNGGAWCPKHQITKDVREWLEIDLHRVHVLKSTKTQGRFGNGQGQEYAEQYMLEYWRPGLHKWTRWRDRMGKEIISGNTNTYTVVEHVLDPPVIGSKLRFVPYSLHPRTVCLRVEIVGCIWTEGLLSYSMPQGVQRGSEVDLEDETYDGRREGEYLQGGLGQLVDGQRGQDNFRLDMGNGKGYEWIGWKNETSHSVSPEILFEFDRVRNFSAMYLHTNNIFTKDVQVFSQAKVYFSIGGRFYNGEPVYFSYMPDVVMEHARNVTIKLHNRIARYIKIHLYFSSKWIMISEISFDSVVLSGNFSEEDGEAPLENEYPLQRDGTQLARPDDDRINLVSAAPEETSADNSRYIGLIIGVLAAVILLLVGAILFIVVRHRRLKPGTLSPHGGTLSCHGGIGAAFSDKRFNTNVKISIDEPEIEKNGGYHEPYSVPLYNAAYATIGHKILPIDGPSPEYSECTSQDYAVPLGSESIPPMYPTLGGASPLRKTPQHNIRPTTTFFPKPPSTAPPSEKSYYAATDICKGTPPPPNAHHTSLLKNNVDPVDIRGICGNSAFVVPSFEVLKEVEVWEFPREQLKVLEKLGETTFGEVLLCEPEGLSELVDMGGFGDVKLVSVKTLKTGVIEAAQIEFHQEVKNLARLKDPNLAMVIAVCWADPRCVITEYPEEGDLNFFLQQHLAETTVNRPPSARTLSYGCLIFMATQIASAMKYLESLRVVHRDLAARNCLVSTNYQVKVSDIAICRSSYSAEYFSSERHPNVPLPIRWMAWESLLLGKYSTKSDVWSFAVTLWEVLTFARDQPFDELSDEGVIDNLTHFGQNDDEQVILSQPINCPKEIYDLMRECWNRNELNRPNFREIHLFLQRKNLGYKPGD